MSLALISLVFLIFVSLMYVLYGGWVAKVFALNDAHPTPAHTLRDDKDFIPTKKFSLFAQHFSAIAAAGPIAGPIVACQQYGWLPCVLWISLGVVFIGAVHDFSTLATSVRHGGSSIAHVTRECLGERAGKSMMLFIWLSLLYIIVAFTDITAASFATAPDEFQNLNLSTLTQNGSFHPGGAVACAALLYMLLSLTLGVIEKLFSPPLWLTTLIFVPLTFACAYIGPYFSEYFVFSTPIWIALICLYCVIASVTPVWLFLQPRGYLGGFVLYSALALGVIGIFFGGHTIEQPAFKGFDSPIGGLFPFLFVTIACGACSGFHGLVCSGTTSKQVDKESHMHAIGYGAMLAEGFVAIIALAIIMMMKPEAITGLKPGSIYGLGIGEFLTMLIGPEHRAFAMTFGAMAFSTFVFDTLDVATRLGRYLLQELIRSTSLVTAMAATVITVAIPWMMLTFMPAGSWSQFWSLFGAANQLLAALSLLSITLWLKARGKKTLFTLLPMLFVLSTTLVALVQIAWSHLQKSQSLDLSLLNAIVCMILIALALYQLWKAFEQSKIIKDSQPTLGCAHDHS
jgi:carbon starvation protein